jgi:hypothetical protein
MGQERSIEVKVSKMYLEDDSEWNHIHPNDLWVYNKLILSRVLGYTCGPTGTTVPKPDFYIVRPCMNLLGMGRFARIELIHKYTERFHPSEFWCEIFEGDHISIDYHHKKQDLTVLGTREFESGLYKWSKWEKIDYEIKFPSILDSLVGDYEWINCEFIGNKLIEVHFRRNPDFRFGNSEAIPVWNDDEQVKYEGYQFIDDPDYLRKGFWVK